MELSDIRKEIDEIDSQLLPLFLRRMKCAEQVAAIKKEKGLPILNAQREQEILDRAAQKASAYAPAARHLYSAMMEVSRERQHQLLDSDREFCKMLENSPSLFPKTAPVLPAPVYPAPLPTVPLKRFFPTALWISIPSFIRCLKP